MHDDKNEGKKAITRKKKQRNNDACTSNNTRVEAGMEFLAKSVCSFEADVERHHPVGKIELILRVCVYVS